VVKNQENIAFQIFVIHQNDKTLETLFFSQNSSNIIDFFFSSKWGVLNNFHQIGPLGRFDLVVK
jgi:hypothetical protein